MRVRVRERVGVGWECGREGRERERETRRLGDLELRVYLFLEFLSCFMLELAGIGNLM